MRTRSFQLVRSVAVGLFVGATVLCFAGWDRWRLAGAWAIIVTTAVLISERRKACPVCGKRGFSRVVYRNSTDDPDDSPFYEVRHCESCGARHVESARGVQPLPEEGWRPAARRYARNEDGPPTCRSCGYDLRATPQEGGALLHRCPECGTIPDTISN